MCPSSMSNLLFCGTSNKSKVANKMFEVVGFALLLVKIRGNKEHFSIKRLLKEIMAFLKAETVKTYLCIYNGYM